MSGWLNRVAGRIAQQTYLIVKGHILNAPWKSREDRRKKRYSATLEAATGYLRRYVPYIRSLTPYEKNGLTGPERAFTIWFQGEENAPELVKACFRSMRRNLSQEVVVLDKKTIFNWISLPDEIIEKWRSGKMRPAHFSDICRVELLYRHGGLWFDATDFVTGIVPQEIMDTDFFMFMAGDKVRGSYSFVQNCFIRSKKGAPLLGLWRKAILKYWENENSVINYFTHQLLFRQLVETNPCAARLFADMPHVDQDPTHALWGDHCTDPYTPETFRRLTSGAFFQKTNYKDKRLKSLPSGCMAEYLINQ